MTDVRGRDAHSHQWESVPGAHVVDDAQPEPDRRRSIGGPQHQRIPDGLDLLGLVAGQQLAHGHTEPGNQVGGPLVPVGLGQGPEPVSPSRSPDNDSRLSSQPGADDHDMSLSCA